jgi:hypothetical protein
VKLKRRYFRLSSEAYQHLLDLTVSTQAVSQSEVVRRLIDEQFEALGLILT